MHSETRATKKSEWRRRRRRLFDQCRLADAPCSSPSFVVLAKRKPPFFAWLAYERPTPRRDASTLSRPCRARKTIRSSNITRYSTSSPSDSIDIAFRFDSPPSTKNDSAQHLALALMRGTIKANRMSFVESTTKQSSFKRSKKFPRSLQKRKTPLVGAALRFSHRTLLLSISSLP